MSAPDQTAIWTNSVRVDLSWRTNRSGQPEQDLYLSGLYIGGVLYSASHGEFHSWLMLSEDGQSVHRCLTLQEAKDALMDAALAALLSVV